MPRINLLPPEVRIRLRERRIFAFILAGAGVVVLILVVLLVLASMNVSREEDNLAREQAERDRLSTQVQALQQFEQLDALVKQTRNTLAAALAGDVSWSRFLNDVSLMLPDDSWLTNLSLSAAVGQAPNAQASFGTLGFQGLVFDFPGLAGWLTRMAKLDGLTFLYLSSGAKQDLAGREVVSFAANANVTQSLLSQRCTEGKRCP